MVTLVVVLNEPWRNIPKVSFHSPSWSCWLDLITGLPLNWQLIQICPNYTHAYTPILHLCRTKKTTLVITAFEGMCVETIKAEHLMYCNCEFLMFRFLPHTGNKRFRCCEAKIEESEKASSYWKSKPGHLPCAASALPLNELCNNWTTTNPHNHQYVLYRWYWNASVTHPTATRYVPLELGMFRFLSQHEWVRKTTQHGFSPDRENFPVDP